MQGLKSIQNMGTKAPRPSTGTSKSGRLSTAAATINPGPSEAKSSKDGFFKFISL